MLPKMSDTPAPLSREALEARRTQLVQQQQVHLQQASASAADAARCDGAIALLNEQLAALGPAPVAEPAAEVSAT